MSSSEEEFLFLFGWDGFFASHMPDYASRGLIPGRIICEEKNLYRVQMFTGAIWASVSGKMQYAASTRADYPAVGDWVLVEASDLSVRGVIQYVFPRKTALHRKEVGSNAELQFLSTNVDYVFVTSAVNGNFNLRRIERYLTMVWASGAIPVILLTKADLYPEMIGDLILATHQEFPGVQVHDLSKEEFDRADFFSDYLKEGKTSVFVGSSGVGKSTLVNFLIGEEQIKTRSVRESDGKGRHTTTSRNLYVSRLGGIIIDTPGIRELQLSNHKNGLEMHFSDIEDLISQCHFTDCHHLSEPGCAVKESLAKETLMEARWKSYQKLAAEIHNETRKQNRSLRARAKSCWKKASVSARTDAKPQRGIKP